MSVIPFAVDFDDTAAALIVTGEVDESESLALQAAIEERSAGFTSSLVVDLSAVTYLPSVAIGVLAKATRKFTGAAVLELVAAEGSVAQRVLVVCALPHRTA